MRLSKWLTQSERNTEMNTITSRKVANTLRKAGFEFTSYGAKHGASCWTASNRKVSITVFANNSIRIAALPAGTTQDAKTVFDVLARRFKGEAVVFNTKSYAIEAA